MFLKIICDKLSKSVQRGNQSGKAKWISWSCKNGCHRHMIRILHSFLILGGGTFTPKMQWEISNIHEQLPGKTEEWNQIIQITRDWTWDHHEKHTLHFCHLFFSGVCFGNLYYLITGTNCFLKAAFMALNNLWHGCRTPQKARLNRNWWNIHTIHVWVVLATSGWFLLHNVGEYTTHGRHGTCLSLRCFFHVGGRTKLPRPKLSLNKASWDPYFSATKDFLIESDRSWRQYENKHTHPKSNMTIEKHPFRDVSPIKHGEFPWISSVMLVFGGVSLYLKGHTGLFTLSEKVPRNH